MKALKSLFASTLILTGVFTSMAKADAYLEITLKIDDANRGTAAGVYAQYKDPFMKGVTGARAKLLLIRKEDVQVLHQFDTAAHAADYLKSDLFNKDVVTALKPLLAGEPEVRIYEAP